MRVFLVLAFSFSFANALAFQSNITPSSHFLIAQADEDIVQLIKEHRAIMSEREAEFSAQNSSQQEEPLVEDSPRLIPAFYPPESQSNTPLPSGPILPPLSPIEEFSSSGSASGDQKPRDELTQYMTKCFADIKTILNERMRKELIKNDPSAKDHISCYNNYAESYYHGIWFEKYPGMGSCYDNRKGVGRSGYFADSGIISGDLKEKKLSQCWKHLDQLKLGKNPKPPAVSKPPTSPGSASGDQKPKDKLTQYMTKCFADIKTILNERMRKELIKNDPSAKDHISCYNNYAESYYHGIWFEKYPGMGSCYDNRKGMIGQSGYSADSGIISGDLKEKKLSQCWKHLDQLKLGKNPKPPAVFLDPKAVAMAKCLSDMQKLVNAKQRETLIARGVKPINIQCNTGFFPANSSVWNPHITGGCYDTTTTGKSIFGYVGKDLIYPEETKDKLLESCLANLKQAGQCSSFKYTTGDFGAQKIEVTCGANDVINKSKGQR